MTRHGNNVTRSGRLPGMLALTFSIGLGACQLAVDAPDRVLDKDLNTPEAVTALEAGAVRDFDYAAIIPGGGGVFDAGAMLTDELVHSGTWIGLRGLSDGESKDDWVESQARWGDPSRARWTAEQAVDRISQILTEQGKDPSSSAAVAVVALHAGLSNLMLGDNFCQAVIDGGPYQDYKTFYTRALPYLQQAIDVGTAAGDGALTGNWDDGDDVAMAARGAMARVQMQLGDWSAATAAAAMVPTDFVYNAVYSQSAGVTNDWHWWGYLRDETTVWGTPFMTLGKNVDDPADTGDPRVPYDIKLNDDGTWAMAGDNRRPFFRQLKYPSYASPIGIVKGTEARLIEAEADLVANGAAAAANVVAKINEVRAQYSGVNPIAAGSVTTANDAWQALMTERGIELWLEGKRLGDWRRWASTVPGVNSPVWDAFKVVRDEATGQPYTADVWQAPILDTEVWAERGDICIQVSKDEKNSNPNLH